MCKDSIKKRKKPQFAFYKLPLYYIFFRNTRFYVITIQLISLDLELSLTTLGIKLRFSYGTMGRRGWSWRSSQIYEELQTDDLSTKKEAYGLFMLAKLNEPVTSSEIVLVIDGVGDAQAFAFCGRCLSEPTRYREELPACQNRSKLLSVVKTDLALLPYRSKIMVRSRLLLEISIPAMPLGVWSYICLISKAPFILAATPFSSFAATEASATFLVSFRNAYFRSYIFLENRDTFLFS